MVLLNNRVVDCVELKKEIEVVLAEFRANSRNFVDKQELVDYLGMLSEVVILRDNDVVDNMDDVNDIVMDCSNEFWSEYTHDELVEKYEWNDDLVGFVLTLKDKRIVQIQYEQCDNVLSGNHGDSLPKIDYENDYGLSINEKEKEFIEKFIKRTEDIFYGHEDNVIGL